MMTDQSKMPFGEHKGKEMGMIPGKYLLQLEKSLKPGPVKEYIENNRPVLGKKNRY
jgi:uncharacterized protein (DUF3820 family)